MASVLSTADLVVLLSEYEAHPVAVMEALALGRRVLTSDTSGFAELAQKGLTQTVSFKVVARRNCCHYGSGASGPPALR